MAVRNVLNKLRWWLFHAKHPNYAHEHSVFNTNGMKDFQKLLDKITFPGYTFELGEQNGNMFVRVKYNEPDVFTGVNETQYGRKWWLEPENDEMQFIQTCFKALLTSLEHRARENFKYDGLPINFPHRTLKEACEQAKREKSTVNMPPIEFTFKDEFKQHLRAQFNKAVYETKNP